MLILLLLEGTRPIVFHTSEHKPRLLGAFENLFYCETLSFAIVLRQLLDILHIHDTDTCISLLLVALG